MPISRYNARIKNFAFVTLHSHSIKRKYFKCEEKLKMDKRDSREGKFLFLCYVCVAVNMENENGRHSKGRTKVLMGFSDNTIRFASNSGT